MGNTSAYSKGSWIVHTQYGIGQVKGIDVKDISGEETRYYRIKSNNSTFWIPIDQMDSETLRPLSTHEEIQLAIAALQRPPKEMSSNYKERQDHIRKAQMSNTPQAMARIIRDLRARRRNKGPLNTTERSAYRTFKQRLIEEWAVVMGYKTEKVTSKIDGLLNPQTAVADMLEEYEPEPY
jgi:RNA polymerase-interacting CarD/CdnL/TRCF family regulator